MYIRKAPLVVQHMKDLYKGSLAYAFAGTSIPYFSLSLSLLRSA
jgi:hypothetical protein